MTAVATAPDITSQDGLLRKLSEHHKKVFDEDLDRPREAQRLSQICLAERNYLYWQNKQYLVPKVDRTYRTITWESAFSSKDGKDGKSPMFRSCYNNIYSDGKKFISVTGQRPVAMKAVADDAQDQRARRLENIGDLAVTHLHRYWKMRSKVQKMAFHNWVTGTAWIHTHYVADGYRHGYTEEQDVTTESLTEPSGWRCEQCAEKRDVPYCRECNKMLGPESYEPERSYEMPVRGELQRYPKGAVEMDIWSTFYVATAFGVETVDKLDDLCLTVMEAPYRLREEGREPETGIDSVVDQATAEALENIESMGGESNVEYYKRICHQWRWITPKVYGAYPGHIGKALLKQYPKGLMIERKGSKFSSAEHERLMDVWAACKPWTGEHLNAYPMAHFIIDPQLDGNNFYNMAKEIILRAIPRTMMDNTLVDEEAWREKEAIIGEIILSKIGGNQNLKNMIVELPTSRMPDQLMTVRQAMREEMREIDGIQPILFGGGDQAPTWRQTAAMRNQALMQLDPDFENMHEAATEATSNGCKQLERYGVGALVVPPARRKPFSVSSVLDLEEFTTEGWHLEPVPGMPTSYGEQIQRIDELARENPMLFANVGGNHPVNVADMQQMFGVEHLYAPGENEREAALALIEELLAGEPIEELDPMTGGLIRKPSIDVKPFEHKQHGLFAEIIRTWANSDPGRMAAIENPLGYENVQLHGLAQDQAAMMLAQPMAEPGGPPAPGPPSGEESTIPPIETASTAPIEPVSKE